MFFDLQEDALFYPATYANQYVQFILYIMYITTISKKDILCYKKRLHLTNGVVELTSTYAWFALFAAAIGAS